MSKVTPSNNKLSVSQKNHDSGQFRGSQSQGHHSSKPFLGIKGGKSLTPQKKSTTVSFPCQEEFHKELNVIKTKVKEFPQHTDCSLTPYLRAKVNSFKGGQLSLHIHEWVTLITDATILQTISGECIEFISQPFDQVAYPQNSISRDHMSLVDEEIFALQNNGVIMDTIRTVLGLVTPNC